MVAVDIAGNELLPMDERFVQGFKRAKENGLHITVHAGESGPADNVRQVSGEGGREGEREGDGERERDGGREGREGGREKEREGWREGERKREGEKLALFEQISPFVSQAIEELGAERIGHGYHVLEDEAVYQLAREKKIHFEV